MKYRIDGGICVLSVAALSTLNAREQIENGSICGDLHDVLSIKLHIRGFIIEIEDAITKRGCFPLVKNSSGRFTLLLCFFFWFDQVHTEQLHFCNVKT